MVFMEEWKSSLLIKAIPLQMLSCSNTQMTQHTFIQKEKKNNNNIAPML